MKCAAYRYLNNTQHGKSKKQTGSDNGKEIFTKRGEIEILPEIRFSGEYEKVSTDNAHRMIGTKNVRKKPGSNYISLKFIMVTTSNKIPQFTREYWNTRNTKYEILLY